MRLPILRSTSVAEQKRMSRLPKASEREQGEIAKMLSTSASVDVALRADRGLYVDLKTTGVGRRGRGTRRRRGSGGAQREQSSRTFGANSSATARRVSAAAAKATPTVDGGGKGTSPTTHPEGSSDDAAGEAAAAAGETTKEVEVVRAARAYLRSTTERSRPAARDSLAFAEQRALAAPSSTMTPHSYRARAAQQKQLRSQSQRPTKPPATTSARLAAELGHSSLVRDGIEEAVNDRLAEFRRDLPRDLLFKAGMEKYRNANAMDLLASVGTRILAAGRKEAFGIWKRWLVCELLDERLRAASTLQRGIRRLAARRELAVRRALIAEQVKREREIAERRRRAVLKGTHILQQAARSWRARRELKTRRIENWAATKLQGQYRMHDSHRVLTMLLEMDRRRLAGARLLQRAYRGRLGRRFVLVKKRLRRLDFAAAQMVEARDAREMVFRRSGATYEIQVVWRHHRRVKQLRMVIKAARWKSALVMQCAMRQHFARRAVSRRKQGVVDEANSQVAAASKLQSVRRRQLAAREVEGFRKANLTAMLGRRAHKRDTINAMRNSKWQFKRKAANFKFAMTGKKRKEQAARMMQSAWRSHHGRSVVKKKKLLLRQTKRATRLQRKHAMAKRLQHNWRRKMKRNAVNHRRAIKAARTLQRSYRVSKKRRLMEEREAQNVGAITVQAYVRRLLAQRRWHEMKIREAFFGVHVVPIQHMTKRWFARVRKVTIFRKAQRRAELLEVGRSQFLRTLRFTLERILINQFASKRAGLTKSRAASYDAKGKVVTPATSALRGLFNLFTNNEVGLFEYSHWKTILRSAESLVSDGPTTPSAKRGKGSSVAMPGGGRLVDANKAELIFTKCKSTDTKELTYRQFVHALREMAMLRYPGEQFARPTTGNVTERDSRLLKLCMENIFVKPKRKRGGKKQNPYMKKARQQLNALAKDMTDDAQITLKKNMHTRWRALRLARLTRLTIAADRARAVLDVAAAKMQGLYRKRSGRRMLLKLVRRHILKFKDDSSGDCYYFNTRTGQTTWDKPLLLGDGDVAMTQKQADEDTEYVIVCCVCDADPGTAVGVASSHKGAVYGNAPKIARRAEIRCTTGCFCASCYADFNSRGKRAKQAHSLIPQCTSCKYQTATRRMIGDSAQTLCDTCFINYRISAKSEASCAHKKIVTPCSECGEFAARWLCHDCGDDFCHACFGRYHRRGKRMQHSYERLSYYTFADRRIAHQALSQKRHAEAKAELDRVRAVNHEKMREKLARRLQAAWRGRCSRVVGKKWMQTMRLVLRRKYFQDREQKKKQSTAGWKLGQLAKGPAAKLAAEALAASQFVARKKTWRDDLLPCIVTMYAGCPTAWTSEDVSHLLEEGDRILIDQPRAVKKKKAKKAGAGAGDDSPWTEMFDEATQSEYFMNSETGETVWERPVEMAEMEEYFKENPDSDDDADDEEEESEPEAEDPYADDGNDILMKMREKKMTRRERAASRRERAATRKRVAVERKERALKVRRRLKKGHPPPGAGRVYTVKATPDNPLGPRQIPLHKGWPEANCEGLHIYKLPAMPVKEVAYNKVSILIGQGAIGQGLQKARRKVNTVLKTRTLAIAEFAMREKIPKGEVAGGDDDENKPKGSGDDSDDEEVVVKEESEESDPELRALEEEDRRILAAQAERRRKPNKLKVFAANQLKKLVANVFDAEETRANAQILVTAGESNAGWRKENQADGSVVWYNDASGVICYDTPKFILHKRAMAAAREAEIEADKARAIAAEKAEQERERLAMKKKMEARRAR